MRQKTLVTICGAAIAASLFLPWVDQPVIGSLKPWDFVKTIDPAKWSDLAPLTLAFLATFVLGALTALLAVLGWAPRLLAFVTALLPFGLAAYVWLKASDTLTSLGLPPVSGEDVSALSQEVMKIAGFGFYAWAGGAALLLLVALLDSGDRY